jgi:hypothetical protein
VHLVAVIAGRGRAVVADGDGKEMEHEVRVGHLLVAAHEAAGFKMVGGSVSFPQKEPLGADAGAVAPLEGGRDGHGLGAGVLDIDLQMILEVLPHPRNVCDHVDSEGAELGGIADAGELQELRGIDGPATEHDLTGVGPDLAVTGQLVFDGDGPLAVEDDLRDEGPGVDFEVRAIHDRVEVGAGGADPPPSVQVAVEGGKPLLPVPVHVVGERIPGFDDGPEEGAEQGVRDRSPFEHERAVTAPPLVAAGETVLHLLEIRQAVGVVPLIHAGIGRPPLVVHGVAALEDHAVDGARPAEDLAPGVVDAPSVHVGLRLGLVLPVVEAAPYREREGGRHVDEDVPRVVGAAGFEDEHTIR